jgi:hypothetical protein
MCPVGIVAVTPVHGDRPDLFQAGKGLGIKHLLAEGAGETLDVGILVRLAVVDEGEDDLPRHTPRPQGFGDEFRPIVAPHLPRYALTGHQVLEQLDRAGTGWREVRLDRQRLPIALVEDVQHAIRAPAVQRCRP